MSVDQYPALRLLVALGIGLLIGAERERRKGAGPTRSAAGVGTFALTALAGGIGYLVGQALLVAVAAAVVGIFAAISCAHIANTTALTQWPLTASIRMAGAKTKPIPMTGQ